MQHKVIDIICNENIKKPKNKDIVQLCDYCMYPFHKQKIMKCSSKNCKMKICKNCATFINNKPFCNDCIIEIVRHKSLLIVVRPGT